MNQNMLDKALRHLRGCSRPLPRAQAHALARKLIGLPMERRQLALSAKSFTRPEVARALVELTAEEGRGRPSAALEIAELALVVADLAVGPEVVVRDVQIEARANYGNALRLAGRFREALHQLDEALKLLPTSSGDPEVEAYVLRKQTSALYEVGRTSEALAFSDEILRLYRGLGVPVEVGRALIMRGRIYIDRAEPIKAARCNLEALPLVAAGSRRLLFAAVHNLAWALVDCGQLEDALWFLSHSRAFYNFEASVDVTKVRWLRARIAIQAGDTLLAEQELRHVQEAMASYGLSYEVAVAGLELAALLLAHEPKHPEVGELLQAAYTTFTAHQMQVYALAVIPLIHEHVRGNLTAAVLQETLVTKLGKPSLA